MVLPSFAGLEVVVASLIPPRASKPSGTPTARQAADIFRCSPTGSSSLKGERLKGANDCHVHSSRLTPVPIGKEDVSRAAKDE